MTARFRVLITDRAWPDCEIERDILRSLDAEVVEAPSADEQTLCRLVPACDAIMTCWAQVTSAVIRAAERCRLIARFGIGLDNICVSTATERKIPVTCVPDYCVEEVCDHTLALLLALARNVAFFHLRSKQGEYDRQAGPPLQRLSRQTLGLVGLGRIGRRVYRQATALGMSVLAATRHGDDYETGCRIVDLDELLAVSDFVSLHLPLSDESRGILSAAQFRRMKPSAFLINTSRGGLIDRVALWQAIKQGEIAGAALDVFDPEPPDLSQPLYRDERILVTPHAAFLSGDSLRELRRRTATQVADVLQNIRPENLVNAETWLES